MSIRISKRKLLTGVGTAAIVVVTVLLCLGLAWLLSVFLIASVANSMFNNCDIDDPDNIIEDVASFKLPEGAKLLKSSCGGMKGWYAEAVFEMRSAQREEFLESTPLEEPLTNSGTLDSRFCSNIPPDTSSHLYGSYLREEYQWWVYIDTSNPDLDTVYICVSGG
jgi:hypothetical protein